MEQAANLFIPRRRRHRVVNALEFVGACLRFALVSTDKLSPAEPVFSFNNFARLAAAWAKLPANLLSLFFQALNSPWHCDHCGEPIPYLFEKPNSERNFLKRHINPPSVGVSAASPVCAGAVALQAIPTQLFAWLKAPSCGES